MKKNTMMRIASVLMIAVLLTTCVISGTFAKYTTAADAQDEARVAKWGVTVAASAEEAFASQYDDTSTDNGDAVVNLTTTENLVAPGTQGTLATASINGTPEVKVEIVANAELTLTGWGADDKVCPLVFTVSDGTTTETFKLDNTIIDTSYLEDEIEKAVEEILAENEVAANTPLTREVTVTWAWAYAVDEAGDVNDTALGDLAAAGSAPTIAFSLDITVTQLDV